MKARILVADDEKEILGLLGKFLKKLEYHVDLADNVSRAMALLKKNQYDILLTDKNMPDAAGSMEGGMKLLQYAKDEHPLTEVIMFTGYATIENAVEAMKLGAFDYILKPIPFNELEEKIERVLAYKRFINSENTLQIYRTLHQQLLSILENRDDLPEDKLREILRTLGAKIDHIFGLQGEYETIIREQSEALEKIEGYARYLKENIPPDNPCFALVEKICEEAKKHV